MNLVERIDEMERRLKSCEDDLRKLRDTLSKVQGQPIIKASYGAQLVLDNTLNVNELLTEVARLAARIERGGL